MRMWTDLRRSLLCLLLTVSCSGLCPDEFWKPPEPLWGPCPTAGLTVVKTLLLICSLNIPSLIYAHRHSSSHQALLWKAWLYLLNNLSAGTAGGCCEVTLKLSLLQAGAATVPQPLHIGQVVQRWLSWGPSAELALAYQLHWGSKTGPSVVGVT